MEGRYLGYDGPCPPWNDERVHRYHFEVIAMHALVIPRRARTVVAEIATFHPRIAREPAGVIAESLLAAVRTARFRLALGDDASSEERRVVNECVSTCSTRGSPYHN